MRRDAGHTLIELMIALVAWSGVTLAAATVALTVHGEQRASAGYTRDLRELRKATTALETDLRSARSFEDLDWRLEGDRLLRGDRLVAERIGAFALRAEGGLVRATITPVPRGGGDPRPGAEIRLAVRMRNAGGGR